MKKRNLAILLVMPFLVALLGIATINTTFNLVENDLRAIEWDYADAELFKIGQTVQLVARGVTDSRYPPGAGNDLVWEVYNSDEEEEPHARISTQGQNYYFTGLSAGEVIITCSNSKGTVFRSLTGIVYAQNAIAVVPAVGGSQANVDPNIYYGEYDFYYQDNSPVKRPAEIDFKISAAPAALAADVETDLSNTTSNISADLSRGKIFINGSGEAKLTVISPSAGCSYTFAFTVVKGGVNVYTYRDLLNCTNLSERGEIAVLRCSFESLQNACRYKDGKPVLQNGKPELLSSNTQVFGNYGGSSFNFANEVYTFKTPYNTSYISQWNAFAAANGRQPIDDRLTAGLRVQKDFYGNGFTINMHNLCYPTGVKEVQDGSTGQVHQLAELSPSDMFRGPLPFYALGDLNGSSPPLVTAYGQDNVGFYIDSSVTVNDVKLKNCDFGSVVSNLSYSGTVAEVAADNVTIKNSVLANGKNVLRAFSAQNFTLRNCMLGVSQNFLLLVGSNQYIPVRDELCTFSTLGGAVQTNLSAFLSAEGEGDKLLNSFVLGDQQDKQSLKSALHSIQSGLNMGYNSLETAGSVLVEGCKFYRSGIASIGLECYFNGPFLYNLSPTAVNSIAKILGDVIPFIPQNVSGVSYPVSIDIVGNTKFYDYKSLQSWDISGLINQNITQIANGLGLNLREITIDDVFPLKTILSAAAQNSGAILTHGQTQFINVPVAYYGGGLNLSLARFQGGAGGGISPTVAVDLLDTYLNYGGGDVDPDKLLGDLQGGNNAALTSVMRGVLTKTVTTVTGFSPFKFNLVTEPGELFNYELGAPASPNFRDLISSAS